MKAKITALLVFSFLWGMAQFSPQSKEITEKFFPEKEIDINTPAFQKKKGFTTYEELMAFLDKQVAEHPQLISYSFIGQSQKGREIPLVRIGKAGSTAKKVKFWVQAGLHGNEPASTEGVLYFIDRLLNDEQYAEILSKVDLAIIPMANIDGYQKQDRYAANGLDLNRDQTKLNAPESVILKQAFSNFNADVALDFHEYRPFRRDYAQLSDWGVTAANDVMFLYSGNLNVPEALRKYTQERFVNAAKMEMDKNGFTNHDYYTSDETVGELQLNQGSVNSRSSATSYALTNCVSTLIEVRGVGLNRTSLKRRTYITFSIAMSYLQTATNNAEELFQVIEDARKSNSGSAVIKSKRRQTGEPVQFIDVSTKELISIDMVVNDAWYSKPTLSRAKPTAYIILPGNEQVIHRLKVLGLEVQTLDKATVMEVESYRVNSYNRDAELFEGVHRQTVETALEISEKEIPAGASMVYLNQAKGNLAIEVLEPESINSFVSFDVLPTELNAELPIYRYLQKEGF